MQMKCRKKLSSFLVCVAVMALFMAGCNGSRDKGASSDAGAQTDVSEAESQVLGEGSTLFMLTVVDKDCGETLFEIHTDKETVGEALKELQLISGEESDFGMYVKTVNGITADYDKDGVYWAFYINGGYASFGIDAAKITEGDTYSLKIEK